MKKVKKAAACIFALWLALVMLEGVRLAGSTDPSKRPLLSLGGVQAQDCCAEYVSLGFAQDYHLGEGDRFVSGQFRVLGVPVVRWDYGKDSPPDRVRIYLQEERDTPEESWMETGDAGVIAQLLRLRRSLPTEETSRPCDVPRYRIAFLRGQEEVEVWHLDYAGVTSGDYFGMGNRQLPDTAAYETVSRLLREEGWTGHVVCY